MKAWIRRAALTGVLAGLVTGAALATPEETDEIKLKVGSTVPTDISLWDLDGETTEFKDLRGKVVFIHFWSDSCPYEERANPIFKKMETRWEDHEDFVMLGINSNQNELGEAPGEGDDVSEFYGSIRKKYEKQKFTHTMLLDHGNVVSDMFQARTTPHCFVIDREGVLQYAGGLDDDPRGQKGEDRAKYVDNAIDAVLAGEKPPVQETKPYG